MNPNEKAARASGAKEIFVVQKYTADSGLTNEQIDAC